MSKRKLKYGNAYLLEGKNKSDLRDSWGTITRSTATGSNLHPDLSYKFKEEEIFNWPSDEDEDEDDEEEDKNKPKLAFAEVAPILDKKNHPSIKGEGYMYRKYRVNENKRIEINGVNPTGLQNDAVIIKQQLEMIEGGFNIKSPKYDYFPDSRYCQLFVKTLIGKTITIDVDLFEPVGKIKDEIWKKLAIFPDQQRLIYGSKQLQDNTYPIQYNVQKNSTIHLVVRLNGGSNLSFMNLSN